MFIIWGDIIFTGLIHCIFHDTMSLSFFKYGTYQTTIALRRDEYRNIVYFNNVLLNKSFVIKDFYKYSRSLSQLHRKQNNKYKDYTDLAIRNFIKGLFSTPPKYNLINDFKNYSEIVDFIKDYKRNARISRHSVYKLKSRRIVIKPVPRTKETELFIEYVKTRYKNFDDNSFFDLNHRIDLNNSSDKIDVDQNKKATKNYTLKRFCTDVIIFLTPSLIFLMLIGYYDNNDNNESSINLNNMITQHKNVYQNNDDCGLVSNIKEIAFNQQYSNNSSYIDTSSCESSDSRTVTKGLTIGLTLGLICLIGLIGLLVTYTLYPQSGNDLVDSTILLQELEKVEGEGGNFMLKKLSRLSEGPFYPLIVENAEDLLKDIAVTESKHPKWRLSEGPYSPDTLNSTKEILKEIARRKSI